MIDRDEAPKRRLSAAELSSVQISLLDDSPVLWAVRQCAPWRCLAHLADQVVPELSRDTSGT
jgi:hypothetical protein